MRALKIIVFTSLFLVACGPADDNSGLSSLTSPTQSCGTVDLPDNYSFYSSYYCGRYIYNGSQRDTLFALDDFTRDQQTLLKGALDWVFQAMNKHFREKGSALENKESVFMKCVDNRAKTDLYPKGYPTTSTIKELAHQSMLAINFLRQFHQNKKRVVTIGSYRNEDAGNTGRATIGRYDLVVSPNPNQNMNIEINQVALESDLYTNYERETFGSTIFHEWLHRAGWVHPNGYPETFIQEAQNCIAFRSVATGLVGLPSFYPDEDYSASGFSSGSGKCQYEHRVSDQGGKRGEINFLDANGKSRACDKNADWKNSCKDSKSSTKELACL